MRVAVVGGGAAGFFSAIAVKDNYPDAEVTIFERTNRVLSKVRVSGGGRCNLTNGCPDLGKFVKAYPRGERFLKRAFHQFSNVDAMNWFEAHGVSIVIQDDGCVFPTTQNSQTIIDCLTGNARKCGVMVKTSMGIDGMSSCEDGGILLHFIGDEFNDELFDKVIVTTGGSPTMTGLSMFMNLGHEIAAPVPSLFTFNIDDPITDLTGIVVNGVQVSLPGTKIKESGALLITHWGMSGPAILKVSSYGARILNEHNYQLPIAVNWIGTTQTDVVVSELQKSLSAHGAKLVVNHSPYDLSMRLWRYLVAKCGINEERRWSELGSKSINKLANTLTNDTYNVAGKGSFKDEFVTCGGVALSSVDSNTMQSKVCPNLYFAGEILDIDGVTGGFNFQAAWTTAFIAGKLR